ncbi:hypothetical protein [Roseospira visakhapatnamensis]|uniref:Uncharacterized protein n=1 Tax=Roseospira visakhapatnamensis TaxID=390880 RepID=A0A7W6RFF3_9PROT|nr:hypothetical protein [Roseospira visakhapatnamensis]MBB4266938.1 hypothetical protein [Roseospira visakhapatnamensis]
MSQRRTIRVLQARPPGVSGVAALDDLTLIVVEGLRELGHAVDRVTGGTDPRALTVLIGGHLLPGPDLAALPPEVVVYNAVPIPVGGIAATHPDYARLLVRNPVWDVSRASLDSLAQATSRAEGLSHVPPGWVPALGRVPPARAQDIGLLFIGGMDRARWRLLADLEAKGLEVRHVAEVHGHKRDALVARARAVLELPPLKDQAPEPTRLLYLLANRKAVIAEPTLDLEADEILRGGVRIAAFAELARACQRLNTDIDGRNALELRGFDAVRRRDAATILKRALARLPESLREAGTGGERRFVGPGPSGWARPTGGAKPAVSVPGGTPAVLNLNGGRDPVEEAINLDWPGVSTPVGAASPDMLADPCDPGIVGQVFETERFGAVALLAGGFRRILAPWVPARARDLTGLMTTCLALLAEDGALELLVPYDLSHGAWADPANVRAFNEHAFTAFTDGHAAIGWTRARFVLQSLEFAFTRLGERLEAEGASVEDILRTPRAVDAMRVMLRKRTLSVTEGG